MGERVSKEAYEQLISDRPEKFGREEVNYREAPVGSSIACHACVHYFRRAVDGFSTCEIFRDEETDKTGVLPDWRCDFQTADGMVFPLLEEE